MNRVYSEYKTWTFSVFNALSEDDQKSAIKDLLLKYVKVYFEQATNYSGQGQVTDLAYIGVPNSLKEMVTNVWEEITRDSTSILTSKGQMDVIPEQYMFLSDIPDENMPVAFHIAQAMTRVSVEAFDPFDSFEEPSDEETETLRGLMENECTDPLEWAKSQFKVISSTEMYHSVINELDNMFGLSASLRINIPFEDKASALLAAVAVMNSMQSMMKGGPGGDHSASLEPGNLIQTP